MPSTMMHLLTAHKINPNASALFYIGNIAPDTISTWEEKDKSHFRNLADRSDVMRNLADRTNKNDDFNEGILLHLFLDWKWDEGPFNRFKQDNIDKNWFPLYRHELALSSLALFHNFSWSNSLWLQMLACDTTTYGTITGVNSTDIFKFIDWNYHWHSEHSSEASRIFTLDYMDAFVDETINEYKLWRR